MPRTHPNPGIDLHQINARNDQARHIVAGCASALPTLADRWRAIDQALSDAVLLSALVTRLSAELDRVRLDRANLRAAMRAALAAHADGEPDPMWYLRDELDAPESPPADSRRPR
jgi:outer membrane murein-binding lipoprotein Lpp